MSSIFAIDQIADDIEAEFLRCNIASKVLVGEWQTHKADASPRVILGLGTGEGDDAVGHYAPGAWIPTNAGQVARAICVNQQRFLVWVAAPAPPNTPPDRRARAARAATWDLTNEVLRAWWYSHGGPFKWGSLQWLSEAQGAATYGGALQFVATIPVPVLDIDQDLAVASEFGITTSLELDGPAVTTTPDVGATDDGTPP